MKYETYSHRQGATILADAAHADAYHEVIGVIASITDDEIKEKHLSYKRMPMSISRAINEILRDKLVEKGWKKESAIFKSKDLKDKCWRLDFAKAPVSIEVSFNHGEAIAWNLMKPVLASEHNHVEKAIQTDAAILITVTKELKKAGAFDGAVGEFEKAKKYLEPLNAYLVSPLVIIGLGAPETFKIEKKKVNGRNQGIIVPLGSQAGQQTLPDAGSPN